MPSRWAIRAGTSARRSLSRYGKQAEQDVAVKPIVGFGLCRQPLSGLCHRDAERLDQLAVLHAGGAGRFAGTAVEAQLEVALDARRELEPTVGHGPHQIDAAARAVVLVAGLDVRRTGRRAQTAMDAVEQQVVVEDCAGVRGRHIVDGVGHDS